MKGKMIYLEAPKKTKILEFDVPKAGAGAAVMKIKRASFCGSDLMIWRGDHPSFKTDFQLGHEGLGEIIELGEGVTHDNAGNQVKVGDRVVFAYFPTCMSCSACVRGRYDACKTGKRKYVPSPMQYPHFTGAFGTHMYLLPNQRFYKVPDEVPDYVACSANCALSQVYFGIELADLKAGEWIAIQGAGGLGLHATAIAKFKGAKIISIDGVPQRLELAKRFGADHVIDINEVKDQKDRIKLINEITNGNGPDVGIELTGHADAFVEGVRFMGAGGRYVEMGTVSQVSSCEFFPAEMVRKGLTIYSACHYDPRYLWKAMLFLKDNCKRFPYEEFTDKEYSLEEFPEMMEKAARREITRAQIVME
ncbi:MAG: zinc-binding dehydrogenase [bacterium]|nr:zinc-binding dehydrogenase [bacterium]